MQIVRPAIRCFACVMALPTLCLFGCTQSRSITIRTKPSDAVIRIDGIEQRGHGPIIGQPFTFDGQTPTHRVAASRLGFRDVEKEITQDFQGDEILLELKPDMWHITIRVQPEPAVITVDDKPLNGGRPASEAVADVDMSLDATNNPIQHVIIASRAHYGSATRTISRLDRAAMFDLRLEPLKKSIALTSNPPGATITIDDEPQGITPLVSKPIEFSVDSSTGEFAPRKVRAERAGYDPVEFSVNWDDGKTEYPAIVFAPKKKDVRFMPEPADATVTIDGKEVPRNSRGVLSTSLPFQPLNDKGDLRTYNVVVSKKPGPSDEQWETKNFVLGWENGRMDYAVSLPEIKTRQVEMLEPLIRRGEKGWEIAPQRSATIGTKGTLESPGRTSPQMMTQLAKGTQLGSLAISPDGTRIVFTILSGHDASDFRSQMRLLRTDGGGEPEVISDGKWLDITPSFTPDGQRIVFASNRAGQGMDIWQMAATAGANPVQLTRGEGLDLWPVVDSDPQPRLFYQSMIDARPDARLCMTLIESISRTDLASGMQPRVNPTNDAVLFTMPNEKTGRREIFRASDRGGDPENLTSNPDADAFDANWSKDGGKIVFASDRGIDDTGRHNYDIWMIDLSKPNQLIQLTTNGSRDDCPVFDATGRNVFFRSNRGGAWGIWKIAVKQ